MAENDKMNESLKGIECFMAQCKGCKHSKGFMECNLKTVTGNIYIGKETCEDRESE